MRLGVYSDLDYRSDGEVARQSFGEEISMAEPTNYEAAADPLAPEMPVTESDFAN